MCSTLRYFIEIFRPSGKRRGYNELGQLSSSLGEFDGFVS